MPFSILALALVMATEAQGPAKPAAKPPATDLLLAPGDLRIEQLTDGGYHLYVRKKPGLASILLSESTKDPEKKADNYAYRSPTWNPVNGDEKRILDGAFIAPEKKLHSIIDSTPEPDAQFGEAFHLFIPWVVDWGYSWSRHGQTFLSDGTFVNIRAFALPYADYRGAFMDNPYLIRVTQKPSPRPAPKPKAPEVVPEPAPEATLSRVMAPEKEVPPPPEEPAPPPPEPQTEPEPLPPPPVKEETPPPEKEHNPDLYMAETVRAFEGISSAGKGRALFSEGESDIVPQLSSLLDRAKGKSVDLVVCLDTTDSMKDDIEAVKKAIPEMLKDRLSEFKSFRLGFVLYKDYFEDYVVKKYNFTSDFSVFTAELSSVRVAGGRDIPEAVYEALYASLTEYPWIAEKKMIVLIGDAPPHPIPRGKIDRAMVEKEAARLGVEMDTIILPH